MEALVKRMAKRLATRYARKRHRAHKGKLDVRKTIRKCMGYGGVPFDIVWKTETIEKPKIVAICDVSRSVAAAAQFMLLFLYCLNEVIEKLEAFAFSDRLIRVGDILEDEDLDAAIAKRHQEDRHAPHRLWPRPGRLLRAAPRRPRSPHHGDHPGRRALQLRQPAARYHARDRAPGAGGDLAQPGAGDLLGPGRLAMDQYQRFCHVAKVCNTLNQLSGSSRTCCAPICHGRQRVPPSTPPLYVILSRAVWARVEGRNDVAPRVRGFDAPLRVGSA